MEFANKVADYDWELYLSRDACIKNHPFAIETSNNFGKTKYKLT